MTVEKIKGSLMNYKLGSRIPLDENQTLKIAKITEVEVKRIGEFNKKVFGNKIQEFVERVILRHPRKEKCVWFYIEENKTKEIISSLALLPAEWIMEGSVLPYCELGFVGTLEEYRGQGLIETIYEYYKQVVDNQEFIFSALRGVPFFYRRLNYEFALPLDNLFSLPLSLVPTDHLDHLIIRKASEEDLPFIAQEYEKITKNLCIATKFNREIFQFRNMNAEFNENKFSAFMLEDKEKQGAYFTVGIPIERKGMGIMQTSAQTPSHMIRILQFVKQACDEKDLQEILYCGNEKSSFGQYIVSLGGVFDQRWAWQVHIPDLKRFFQGIQTVLEKRISQSTFNRMTQTVKISNYHETVELVFVEGKITKIDVIKGYLDRKECDVSIPGGILTKLLLSDRTVKEISHIVKDAFVKQDSAKLIDVLFPKRESYPDPSY